MKTANLPFLIFICFLGLGPSAVLAQATGDTPSPQNAVSALPMSSTAETESEINNRVKFAQSHLCSDSIQPNDTKKNRLEADGCVNCENAKLSKDGLNETSDKIKGLFRPIHWSESAGRAEKDLAFLKTGHYSQMTYSSGDQVSGLKNTIKTYESYVSEVQAKLAENKKSTEVFDKAATALHALFNDVPISDDQLNAVKSFMKMKLADYTNLQSSFEKSIAQLKSLKDSVYGNNSYYKGLYQTQIDQTQNSLDEQKATVAKINAAIETGNIKSSFGGEFAKFVNDADMALGNSKGNLYTTEQQLEHYSKTVSDYKKMVADQEKLQAVNSNPVLAGKAKELSDLEAKAAKTLTTSGANFNTCGMSVAELAALQSYTDSGYGNLNSSLRAGGESAKSVKPFADELKSALMKLRRYTGNVNRGASIPPEILKTYQPGNIITFNAFTSSAIGTGFNSGVHFVIHSLSGRFVGSHSTHEYEREVIFAPETKFKVLSRKESDFAATEIVLEEVPSKPRPGVSN